MADGIGRIGNSNYGYVGFGPQKRDDETSSQNKPAEAPAVNYEETQVDPSKVMEFMANNNFFVAPVETHKVGEVDEATENRIAGYMENFETIYGVIVEEFGEELAPFVMDVVMDNLMGMAA